MAVWKLEWHVNTQATGPVLSVPVQADGGSPLAPQLLAYSADRQVVLRIEALGALKGMATHYTASMPAGVWPQLLAAARFNLDEAAAAAAAVSGRASPRRSTSSSAPSPSSSPGGGGGGGGGWSASSAHGTAASGSSSQQPAPWALHSRASQAGPAPSVLGAAILSEDKAAQLAMQLLGAYLSGLARQQVKNCTTNGCALNTVLFFLC